MAIKVIICLALGYIFGCFQTGYFYGKVFKGIDVRNYGSGNAGTTNTLRTLGKPAGYIVFLGDALKAVFAVWIVRYLLFPGLGDVTKILETVTALGVVLGHNYPFYMNFKGGKGIAATGGFMFALIRTVPGSGLIKYSYIRCRGREFAFPVILHNHVNRRVEK